MARRPRLKTVAFWTAFAAGSLSIAAFTLTTDRWWEGTPLGLPLSMGHGVVTAFIETATEAASDPSPLDYLTPAPLWWALPTVNRWPYHNVFVLPIVPTILLILATTLALWPARSRWSASRLFWRTATVAAVAVSVFVLTAYWRTTTSSTQIPLVDRDPYSLDVARGALCLHKLEASPSMAAWRAIVRKTPAMTPTSQRQALATDTVWLPQIATDAYGRAYFLPLWIIAPALLVLTWFVGRRTFKPERGGCRKCGYSLSGLKPGAVCPECGTAPAGVSSVAHESERFAGRLHR